MKASNAENNYQEWLENISDETKQSSAWHKIVNVDPLFSVPISSSSHFDGMLVVFPEKPVYLSACVVDYLYSLASLKSKNLITSEQYQTLFNFFTTEKEEDIAIAVLLIKEEPYYSLLKSLGHE